MSITFTYWRLWTLVWAGNQGWKRFEEQEMRAFRKQTASVLACAHSKRIAHRDVKPDNVFKTGYTFGCFFEKRQTSYMKSFADPTYLSPQQRKAYAREYNAFKADVFALGPPFFPYALVTAERMQEAVDRHALLCTTQVPI